MLDTKFFGVDRGARMLHSFGVRSLYREPVKFLCLLDPLAEDLLEV